MPGKLSSLTSNPTKTFSIWQVLQEIFKTLIAAENFLKISVYFHFSTQNDKNNSNLEKVSCGHRNHCSDVIYTSGKCVLHILFPDTDWSRCVTLNHGIFVSYICIHCIVLLYYVYWNPHHKYILFWGKLIFSEFLGWIKIRHLS